MQSAVAVSGSQRVALITTSYCEYATAGLLGGGFCGGSSAATPAPLPLLVVAPGTTVLFRLGFTATELQLDVSAPGYSTSFLLAGATWRAPDDLPHWAAFRLRARGQDSLFDTVTTRTAEYTGSLGIPHRKPPLEP